MYQVQHYLLATPRLAILLLLQRLLPKAIVVRWVVLPGLHVADNLHVEWGVPRHDGSYDRTVGAVGAGVGKNRQVHCIELIANYLDSWTPVHLARLLQSSLQPEPGDKKVKIDRASVGCCGSKDQPQSSIS